MSDGETRVQEEIEQVARELEALQERLQRIADSLPVSEREDVMYAGEEEYDFATEAQAVLQCVRTDGIAPAIRDLWRCARTSTQAPGGG